MSECLNTPVPRFKVGDTVYVAAYDSSEVREVCPDCCGTKQWLVVLPTGEECPVPCRTCESGYCSLGTVARYELIPNVWQGTIGSVRLDTYDKNHPVSYMLLETGVGSGTIHYEENLFLVRDRAEARAKQRAGEVRKNQSRTLKDNRKRQTHIKARWERHSAALCAAVEKLLKTLPEVDEKAVKRIEKYLRWIRRENV